VLGNDAWAQVASSGVEPNTVACPRNRTSITIRTSRGPGRVVQTAAQRAGRASRVGQLRLRVQGLSGQLFAHV